MERRLRILREEMDKERERREASKPAAGGARWTAADTTKGSITGYSREVVQRQEAATRRRVVAATATSATATSTDTTSSRLPIRAGSSALPVLPSSAVAASAEGPGGAAPSAVSGGDGPSLRADARKRPTSARRRVLTQEDAASWSSDAVIRWLGVVGLDKYADLFRENEIDGKVLLELGTDDLDYLNIKALGHRKMLLQGVDQLRAAVGLPTRSPLAPSSPAPATSSSSTMTSTDPDDRVGGESRAPKERTAPGLVHWSAAKPLQASSGSDTGSDRLGAGEMLDEAAEHASFVQAVLEWRKSVGIKVDDTEYPGGSKSAAATSTSSKSSVSTASTGTGTGTDASGSPSRSAAHGGGARRAAASTGTDPSPFDPFTDPAGGGSGDLWTNPFGSGAGSSSLLLPSEPSASAPPGTSASASASSSGFKPVVSAMATPNMADLDAGPRLSCYQCFTQFYRNVGHFVERGGHPFCSTRCADRFDAQARERERQKEERERRAREAAAATAATAATATSAASPTAGESNLHESASSDDTEEIALPADSVPTGADPFAGMMDMALSVAASLPARPASAAPSRPTTARPGTPAQATPAAVRSPFSQREYEDIWKKDIDF